MNGRLIVFFVFFAVSAWAMAYCRSRTARAAFASVFLAFFVWAGITGQIAWPFFGWHLYAHPGREVLVFHEFRFADADGNEIKIDARSAPPTIATPANRFATRMLEWEERDALSFADFLLRGAREYRARIEDGSAQAPLWKFPPHQSGVLWTRERLAAIGTLEEVRIYRIETRYSPDGREVVERDDRMLVRYRNAPDA